MVTDTVEGGGGPARSLGVCGLAGSEPCSPCRIVHASHNWFQPGILIRGTGKALCGISQVGLLWMETRKGRNAVRKGAGREALELVLSLWVSSRHLDEPLWVRRGMCEALCVLWRFQWEGRLWEPVAKSLSQQNEEHEYTFVLYLLSH